MQSIAATSLVVPDDGKAIGDYTAVVGFELREDRLMAPGKRWVRVVPPGSHGPQPLLAPAVNETQALRIGNQTGGRVFLFLQNDDFQRDHAAHQSHGVVFVEEPRNAPYGTVAVFRDRCGDLWHLIEPTSAAAWRARVRAVSAVGAAVSRWPPATPARVRVRAPRHAAQPPAPVHVDPGAPAL